MNWRKATQKFFHRSPYLLLAVYWISLFIATHLPKVPYVHIPGKGRTAHAVAYAMLACLLLICLRTRSGGSLSLTTAGGAILVIAVYALLDEYSQPLTGRDADIIDWSFDLLGAIGLTIVYLLVVPQRPTNNPP